MEPRELDSATALPQPSPRPLGGVRRIYGCRLDMITALLLTTMLSGCVFGNYTSTPPAPDTVTGYYAANPQSLTFCTTRTATNCTPTGTNFIPSFITDEITNPVALIVQDDTTGDSVLTSASGNGQTALPIWVSPVDNVTLSYDSSTTAQTLWQDPTCTTTTYLDESGSIVSGGGQPVSGTNSMTQGSLTLKVQVIQTFDSSTNSCASELTIMSNCYRDVTQCGGADNATNQQLQTQAQALFAPYIQAGAMAVTDIPGLVNVSYEVHYQ